MLNEIILLVIFPFYARPDVSYDESPSSHDSLHSPHSPRVPTQLSTLLSSLLPSLLVLLLSVLGLLSTVLSLSAYWQLLDLLLPPRHLLPSLLLPGLLAPLGLVVLRVLSSLHGGVVTSPRLGELWPGWLLTGWLVKERGGGGGEEEGEAFMGF